MKQWGCLVINQIIIALLGALAIWLTSSGNQRVRLWGYVAGLISQPFWLWTTWEAQQWGMFALSVFYTFAWCKGIVANSDDFRTWNMQRRCRHHIRIQRDLSGKVLGAKCPLCGKWLGDYDGKGLFK